MLKGLATRDAEIGNIIFEDFKLEDLGMSEEKLAKSGIKMYEKDSSEYYKNYIFVNAILDILAHTRADFQCDISMWFGGMASLESSLRGQGMDGQGLGKLIAMFIRAATY